MESIKFRINTIDKQHRGETYYIKNKYFPFPKVFRNKLKIGETLPPTNSFFFSYYRTKVNCKQSSWYA